MSASWSKPAMAFTFCSDLKVFGLVVYRVVIQLFSGVVETVALEDF